MNRQAYLWDTETYKIKHILKGHMNEVVNCEFSSDGALLATASYDTKIFIWNPYTGLLMKQF
jgi:WD repeat/SOCS box-containing protein 1